MVSIPYEAGQRTKLGEEIVLHIPCIERFQSPTKRGNELNSTLGFASAVKHIEKFQSPTKRGNELNGQDLGDADHHLQEVSIPYEAGQRTKLSLTSTTTEGGQVKVSIPYEAGQRTKRALQCHRQTGSHWRFQSPTKRGNELNVDGTQPACWWGTAKQVSIPYEAGQRTKPDVTLCPSRPYS